MDIELRFVRRAGYAARGAVLRRYSQFVHSLRAVRAWFYRLMNVLSLRGSVCPHTWLDVVEAHVTETRYAYSYWQAHVVCHDCGEEWFLQARTPGFYSSRPSSPVYEDSSNPRAGA